MTKETVSKKETYSICLTPEVVEKLDLKRGLIPRSAYIEELIKTAIE